ncbi:MAG TPA: fluoride efflux transporter CrcB [Burkholderiaceae bacterium]|nr:fluoride efflux transporter CrcB [Burkholderiaceae bacterium]
MTRDGPLPSVLVAVAIGAALGAWLRWALSYWLNPRIAHLPLGTLVANLVGGYIIGLAIAAFAAHPSVPPFWRLLLITGFLGGLTTFSTFSAESVVLLQGEQWGAAALHGIAHVAGSLLATVAGIATYRALA